MDTLDPGFGTAIWGLGVIMDTSKMGYRTAVHLLMTWMVLAWEMASGNLYTSIHGLRKLQAQAGQFADKLDNFIQIEEERIKELRRLANSPVFCHP